MSEPNAIIAHPNWYRVIRATPTLQDLDEFEFNPPPQAPEPDLKTAFDI